MEIFRAPRVTLIARPEFIEPEHLHVQWRGDSSPGERLAEFAGRICYMSQHNPANRSTAEYLENIKKQGHGSVLEHAVYVLLIEGISRSCSHELVRHRAGFGYSQLSQRYVDESHAAFVMPPAILGDPTLETEWEQEVAHAQAAYVRAVAGLMEVLAVHPISDPRRICGRLELGNSQGRLGLVEARAARKDLAGRASEMRAFELLHGRARMRDLRKRQSLAHEIHRVAPVERSLETETRNLRRRQQARLQRRR